VSTQNGVAINDYIEPADQLRPDAADADNGGHDNGCYGNDDASQPQYAQLMPTRRNARRRGSVVCRRPYEGHEDPQYAAIDHNLSLQQTVVVVVDQPWSRRRLRMIFIHRNIGL